MPAKPKSVSNADAAAVLRIYESEVSGVEGDVATTIDGQRYQLTGDKPGDFVWLKADPRSLEQMLETGSDVVEPSE